MVQVCDLHEGLVEVVKLQDAGQQEETRDDDTGEEFGQSKRLQADRCKSTNDRRASRVFDTLKNTNMIFSGCCC